MILEEGGVDVVARLMMISARTAPKGKGVDALVIKIVNGKDLAFLAEEMRTYGEMHNIGFFIRDSQNIADCEACVVIGARGDSVVGIDCGGCGYATCEEMLEAQKKARGHSPFQGPVRHFYPRLFSFHISRFSELNGIVLKRTNDHIDIVFGTETAVFTH